MKEWWKYVYCITQDLFHSSFHVFSWGPSKLLWTGAQVEIRSPPSPDHSTSEQNMKEETESPLANNPCIPWYAIRLFYWGLWLPSATEVIVPIINWRTQAFTEDSEAGWTCSPTWCLPEPAPLLTAWPQLSSHCFPAALIRLCCAVLFRYNSNSYCWKGKSRKVTNTITKQ